MTPDELLDTRAGLALANSAWCEGARAWKLAEAEAERTGTWVTPRSPYSAPLCALITQDRRAAERGEG